MIDTIVPVMDVHTSSYVICAQGVAQTTVTEAGKMTNQQALHKIAEYLDSTTAYLQRKRLEAQ